ncbi:SGT1-domain-containing protein [Obba rivulosa]|uniref:SGT1-domain-containing protein n=1 Tax=Obba rivulosa TaxID=1052685 RepID=A0A8E2J8D4_9APHY|nr:SGT1-domain-containing protein [Obba rivulosa]
MSTINEIFNRPPAISEDTLQYTLYPPADISDRASVTTLAALMNAYVESLLPGHMWHRDPFELKVVSNPDGEGYVLEGHMRVGDCVDDEWCAVWLLKEISAKWDVVISVFDSDGEFLLIEAAESLPDWVTPSNAENRVWIYSSHLHLIPLSHVSASSSKPHRKKYPGAKDSDDEGGIDNANDEEDYITAQDAVKLVRDPLINTLAPPEVQEAVWKRICGYPAASRQHIHKTKAYLPVDTAKALSVDPSLVQKAVETFYTRDALQLRAAQRMSRFSPEPSVLKTVTMTRTAYAQLTGQKFYPPKIFGRWKEPEGSQEWRWRDIGMQIACGFEMLYQESKNRADASTTSTEALKSSAEARKEALRRNPEYLKYIQNLISSGYFKGELEGSQLWQTLEDKAVAAFIEARREDDATRPSFAIAVNAAISRASDEVLQESAQEEEDPDDWLSVNAEDFDAMLEKNMGGKGKASELSSDAMDVDVTAANTKTEEDRVAEEQAARLKNLAKRVEEFVEGEGDVEGARFADEPFSDEEFDEELSEEMSEDESEDEHEPARPPGSATEQEKAALASRQEAMDKLVPALDPSEYGKMPASYYSNSQRTAPVTMETEMREETPLKNTDATKENAEPRMRPIRPPILPRDKYEGVDSDDETDEEGGDEDEEEEEEKPQIVGDVEIDMDEEQDDFIEFARQALGVSDEQWGDMIKERKARGAFVPTRVIMENKSQKKTASSRATPQSAAPSESIRTSRPPQPGPRPNVNPNLDSFEAVMQAMDAELAYSRTGKRGAQPTDADKGKGRADADAPLADIDIEAAMDAELRAALEREQTGDDEDEDGDTETDYNLIKNFLESFKSQAGLSGPVGNLAGRLQPGWTLPRDES